MNYKKMTFRASMLGLIVMLFAGLVSCSSDDDDKNIPVEETKVPTTGLLFFCMQQRRMNCLYAT